MLVGDLRLPKPKLLFRREFIWQGNTEALDRLGGAEWRERGRGEGSEGKVKCREAGRGKDLEIKEDTGGLQVKPWETKRHYPIPPSVLEMVGKM